MAAPTTTDTPQTAAVASIHRIEAAVGQVVRGKPAVIRQAVVALLAGGHVLIEDVPGVGKTTLAQTLARAVGLDFQRIQFTSDLLPSDIIGVSIYDQQTQAFEFKPGPLFAHGVLADEINRATPKTQSALLEAMSERRISVDRRQWELPQPFLVLATQNPLEYHGTFPLPESQLDRFLMALTMGYPPAAEERRLLIAGGAASQLSGLAPAIDVDGLRALQEQVRTVTVAEKLVDYMLALAEETRTRNDFVLPVSTRGAQGLYRATQALALCEGRDFAIPDDVQQLAVAVFGHRVVLKQGSGGLAESRAAIRRLVEQVPVPV